MIQEKWTGAWKKFLIEEIYEWNCKKELKRKIQVWRVYIKEELKSLSLLEWGAISEKNK